MRKAILFLSLFVASKFCFSQADTLNRIDVNGKKIGHWRIYGNDKIYNGKGYPDNAIAEEGRYIDGKKVNIWKQFYPSQILKSEIEYKNGRPSGIFKTYYENGCPKEIGKWKNNSYIDTLYRFSQDTCLKVVSKKFFDPKQVGEKKIVRGGYHNNKLELEFSKPDSTKRSKTDTYKSACTPLDPKNGYQKVYDDQKRLCKDGEFKNGELWNGKWYKYTKDGLILKVEIYKNGKYFADGQLY